MYSGGPNVDCPYCSAENSRVVNSRGRPGGKEVYRRRECPACGLRWTTREVILTAGRYEVDAKTSKALLRQIQELATGIAPVRS